ncbi:MAG: TMEM165/GDT1 family protein [Candidatus Hadarchaeales archaeon]
MILELGSLIAAFGIVGVAELGDKTQLAVIALSARHPPLQVFLGAMAAILLVDGASALLGVAIGSILPRWLLAAFGAAIFLAYGVYTFLCEENEERIGDGKSSLALSFGLVAMMEVGDKTQMAILALVANQASPYAVLAGAGLAYLLLMSFGVVLGSKLKKIVTKKYLRCVTALLFLAFGITFALEAAGVV